MFLLFIYTYFQVSNPLAAVCNVGAYMHSTNLLVATSLRNVLGTKVRKAIGKVLFPHLPLVPPSCLVLFGDIEGR